MTISAPPIPTMTRCNMSVILTQQPCICQYIRQGDNPVSALGQKRTLFCSGSRVSKESAFSQKRTLETNLSSRQFHQICSLASPDAHFCALQSSLDGFGYPSVLATRPTDSNIKIKRRFSETRLIGRHQYDNHFTPITGRSICQFSSMRWYRNSKKLLSCAKSI